jgi:ATP-binding cassette, subfamily G (WHITE), member 2, SNQ2
VLISSLISGFTIPRSSMIDALHWIIYISPTYYGFESLMVNEFRTLRGSCSSLIPRGPGYENITLENQVCAAVGAVQGQDFVDGERFVELSYGYFYSNLWRNFGIFIAFGVGFLIALLLFTEYHTSTASQRSYVLFKRGSKKIDASGVSDNEKSIIEKDKEAENMLSGSSDGSTSAVFLPPKQKDIFSWHHLRYTVPTQNGPKRLLDDVSGYVMPGKLTALMGESGAGKTMLLNVLAQRTSVGVVTGDRWVNGQKPPGDFQPQMYGLPRITSCDFTHFWIGLQWFLSTNGYSYPDRYGS